MTSPIEYVADGDKPGLFSDYQSKRAFCLTEVSKVIQSPDEDHIKAFYAMYESYSFAPYGGSIAITAESLAAETVLDCDNYNAMAAYLYEALEGLSPWRFVGYYGGAFGNHSVAFLENERPLYIDPCLCIMGNFDFDHLTSGKPASYVDFHHRDEIQWYRTKTKNAISDGEIRPHNLLYWFESIHVYVDNPASSLWRATPALSQLNAAT